MVLSLQDRCGASDGALFTVHICLRKLRYVLNQLIAGFKKPRYYNLFNKYRGLLCCMPFSGLKINIH